ncbi:hypothetical protein TWF718_004225 [Orbilia javanica]|uniref:Uncharacterized protein n=1 Tax=Orbilia javanica TaxID=47235 RepID=A0AAN8NZB4_9PEZI
MDTPTTSTATDETLTIADMHDVVARFYPPSSVSQTPELTLNDGPWPGHIFIISYENTSKALTYHKEKGVVLEEYNGSQSQRWVCHSKLGWLGFTANPGETTTFIGHYDWKLRCRFSELHRSEMFCVRKRLKGLDGFQILMRAEEDGLWPVGVHEDSDVAVLRGSEAWWGFTMIA